MVQIEVRADGISVILKCQAMESNRLTVWGMSDSEFVSRKSAKCAAILVKLYSDYNRHCDHSSRAKIDKNN